MLGMVQKGLLRNQSEKLVTRQWSRASSHLTIEPSTERHGLKFFRIATMKRLELLIPPPLIMLLVGLMMGTSARLFPALNLASPNNHTVAVAVALLGVAMSLVSIVAFKRARTTTDPRRPALASNLINSGIYRYSRNPMYLGVLLVLAGWAVYLGNVLSILGLLVFIAYITRFQIIPEERLLSQRFGVAFENYMKEVRRWL